MQFQNQYVLSIIKDASVIQGHLPKTFLASVNIQSTKEGDWFFMLEDFSVDHQNIFKELLSKKVAVIVVGKTTELPKNIAQYNVCILNVEHVKTALKVLTQRVRNDYPNTVIAIAGTSVSQSIAILLKNLLHSAGKKAIIIQKNASVFEISCIIINYALEDVTIIFEAHASKIGEMKIIAQITLPSLAVINGISHQDIDTFGSLVDIALEQRSIFSSFSEHHIGIINGDHPQLSSVSYPHPIMKFGFKMTNQIQARKIKIQDTTISFVLKIYKQKYYVTLLTTNSDIILGVLGVVATAKLLEISDEKIVPFLQTPLEIHQCFEQKILPANRGTIINDTHSTDPESMKVSLLAFQNLKNSKKKIVVMGDMIGLGMSSAFWHRQVGRFLRKTPTISTIITVGMYGAYVKKTAPRNIEFIVTKEWHEVLGYLKIYFMEQPVILIKGSSDQGFHNLVTHLSQT